MMSSAVRAKANVCLVDGHPEEHDCRRIQVDFAVHLKWNQFTFSTLAVEMCGAGLTLSGTVPCAIGDRVQLQIAFPGRKTPLEARGIVRKTNGAYFQCEYWAANSYEQQFLDSFVTACARRQELRKANGCAHGPGNGNT